MGSDLVLTKTPVQINFRDFPAVGFPLRSTEPGIGEINLFKTQWLSEFVLILGVRLLDQFMPLQYVTWRVKANHSFLANYSPRGIPNVEQIAQGKGTPSSLPIEWAMEHRTCRLLARSIDGITRDPKVCRVQVSRS